MEPQRFANAAEGKHLVGPAIAYPLSGFAGGLALLATSNIRSTTIQAIQGVSEHGQHQPSEWKVVRSSLPAVEELGLSNYIFADESVEYVHFDTCVSDAKRLGVTTTRAGGIGISKRRVFPFSSARHWIFAGLRKFETTLIQESAR